MKNSPLRGASNRLNDDAVGKAVYPGIEYDAELFVFLANKEDADCGFSIFVESDHSRLLTGLMQKITVSSSASDKWEI